MNRDISILESEAMEIIPLNDKRTFTRQSAQELLPLVYKITETTQREVRLLANRMESIKNMSGMRAKEIEEEINALIDRWQQKLIKLGARPKGLWLADFDDGRGYYCWKYPETEINFWHGYNDGFSGRIPLSLETNA